MTDLRWHKIEEEIFEEDFIRQILVKGKKLCLLKHQGQLRLFQNNCLHAGGILSGGWCAKGKLICPVHRYEYDLETGRGAEGQGDYIDIYPLKKETDGWYAGFKIGLFQRFFGR